MALQSVAEEYFATLNPMASKMYSELQETKCAYEDLWDTLSEKERQQILTETIIKPEVSVKYHAPEKNRNAAEEFAVKIVMDDHCSYRDEHSGPFSFRTRSQRNLVVFRGDDKKPADARKGSVKVTRKKHVPLCAQQELEVGVVSRSDDELSSSSSTLPKTGLDFLDNW